MRDRERFENRMWSQNRICAWRCCVGRWLAKIWVNKWKAVNKSEITLVWFTDCQQWHIAESWQSAFFIYNFSMCVFFLLMLREQKKAKLGSLSQKVWSHQDFTHVWGLMEDGVMITAVIISIPGYDLFSFDRTCTVMLHHLIQASNHVSYTWSSCRLLFLPCSSYLAAPSCYTLLLLLLAGCVDFLALMQHIHLSSF